LVLDIGQGSGEDQLEEAAMVPRFKAIAALLILLLFAPLVGTRAPAQVPAAPQPVPYTVQSDAHITVRADRSASGLSTRSGRQASVNAARFRARKPPIDAPEIAMAGYGGQGAEFRRDQACPTSRCR
jgi:hypothetical protein